MVGEYLPRERIPKNKRIIDYAGEKISHQESLTRENRYMKRGSIWCFQINRRWVRDAAVGRQHRAVHQSFLQGQLLRADRRRHHLDPRRAHHPQGRRAHLRLHDRRRRQDQVPVPAGVSEAPVVSQVRVSESQSQAQSSRGSELRSVRNRCGFAPDDVEAVLQLMRVVEHV